MSRKIEASGTGAERPRRPLRSRDRWFKALAAAVLALFILPVMTLLLFSLTKGYFYPQIVPENWSVLTWRRLLRPGSKVWGAMATTILVGLAVVVIAMLVAVPAGKSLGQLRFRGKRVVEFALLAPLLAPPIVIAMGVDFAFVRLQLSNSFPGVVLVHLIPTAPYAVFIMSGVFANYDPAAEGQARTLGAGRLRAFRFVTLPAIAPGLVVAAALVLIVSWSQYVLTLLVGGGQVVTLSVLLFATSAGGDTAATSALALITVAPVLALLFLASRSVSRLPATRIGAP